LCIEVNFPEPWLEQQALGVDCVLFSTFSEDPIFDVPARGHIAANGFWVSVAVSAQHSDAVPSGVIAPHGYRLVSAPANRQPAVACIDLDRTDPALDIALHRAPVAAAGPLQHPVPRPARGRRSTQQRPANLLS
jgi:predicted amidohydrolase